LGQVGVSVEPGRIAAVDFSRLESQVGDRSVVREVLSLFCEHARKVLQGLDPLGPPEAWRQAAHSLRGSALGVGADALAEACAAAEMNPEAGVAEKTAARALIADRLGAAVTEIAQYAAR
jgi:HPt (histidine-containing phosphotransfer) domain-containing protein